MAFSGLHDELPLMKTIINSITEKKLTPDLIITAGDIGADILLDVLEGLSTFGIPIAFVGGNWELDQEVLKKASELTQVYHISKEGCTYDVFDFIGQDAWKNFTNDKSIDDRRYDDLKSKWERGKSDNFVLVTHHPPLGIFDRGSGDSRYSWKDNRGRLHGGSYGIRKFVEEHPPTIHIFAHLHSDGGKWISTEKTLFTNVSYVGRKTRKGVSGINGSFMMIDTDEMLCVPHHLNTITPKTCICGSIHFLNYSNCINCFDDGFGLVPYSELDNLEFIS